MSGPKPGRWGAPGQVPLLVKPDPVAAAYPGSHGPWVRYRFPWEAPDQEVAVLIMVWDELVRGAGYRWQGHPWDLHWLELFGSG